MIQLESAKEAYMLEAPIEALHRESLEWLEEIEFMKDEAAFFYGLIIRKLKTPYPPPHAKKMKGIENHLAFISTSVFSGLHNSITLHERSFSRMIQAVKQDEQNYRQQHNTLSKKFNNFRREFKELKREIFAAVEREEKQKKLLKK